MKKSTQKVISTILCLTAAAACIGGLSGCGKSQKEVSLTWYMFGDRPAGLDAVMEKANEIIEPEIGVKLDMQYIDSASYAEKMKLKMASSEAYDLAFTGYINGYQEAVALGGLYDITEYIDKLDVNSVIPQFYLDAATVDGKIYGIPNIQVVSNPITLTADKTVVDAAGVDFAAIQEKAQAAKTFDDVEGYMSLIGDALEKIHAARPDLYTYTPLYNLATVPIYEDIIANIAIRADGSSDKLVILTDTEEWQYGVKCASDWYKKGYIRSDIASKGTATTDDAEKRQYAVRPVTWKPGQDAILEKIYLDKPVYAHMQKPYIKRTSALATMTSVGANSNNPEKAVELLKLVNSNKELYNLICWGIEGTNYELDSNGRVEEIEDSGYNGIGAYAWKYGNQFNSLLTPSQDEDVWEQTEKMNNEAMVSPLLGFVPNTDPITNELANISNVNNEFMAKMAYGTSDPSEWMDEYQQKLRQAGQDKVLSELQAQYDEFLKNK